MMTIMVAMTFASACENKGSVQIIPLPVEYKTYNSSYELVQEMKIIHNLDAANLENIIAPFNDYLSVKYGFQQLVKETGDKATNGSLVLLLDKDNKRIPNEGYNLKVTAKSIKLEASSHSGLFYGMQSLIQMVEDPDENLKNPYIGAAEIRDYPRFKWRGLHLDVCRHFMPKEFVKRYIDYMALHKYNTFHFHLTEDQGWRIEIKKYPLLTEVGSVRKETLVGHGRRSDKYDATPHGGFYTQEDIKEIVDYAASKFITVVPEIEMPGHALAALASYPYLGCEGASYEVATKWGVFDDIMCAGKESTFSFLEDVLLEVMSLFPSEYIHIGGDEAPKKQWQECDLCQERIVSEGLEDEHELQSYFIKRIEKFLSANGRKLIGWDEILEGGLAPNAAVMSWRGETGGIEAAMAGHYVVMTPGTHCYLDHYQSNPETEPLAIGGLTTLEKIYSYEPVPDTLNPVQAEYIMGAQGNVWTEYMPNSKHVEYMVYPRAAALSEVVWSPKAERDYPGFLNRLQKLRVLYDYMGLNYSRVEFDGER